MRSAPFLIESMAVSLIVKLKRFASEGREQRLDLADYVKMDNPEVFWSIDAVQQVMHEGRKVQFCYFRHDNSGRRALNRGGRICVATPLRLAHAGGLYYLLTYNDHCDSMTPYRVDRMVDMSVSEEPAMRNEAVATWQLEDEIRLSFGVFGVGSLEPIVFEADESRVCVILDKFGSDLDLYPMENGRAKVYARAPLSPQFFGWFFQMGTHVKLLGSKKAVAMYKDYLREILAMCEERLRRKFSAQMACARSAALSSCR